MGLHGPVIQRRSNDKSLRKDLKIAGWSWGQIIQVGLSDDRTRLRWWSGSYVWQDHNCGFLSILKRSSKASSWTLGKSNFLKKVLEPKYQCEFFFWFTVLSKDIKPCPLMRRTVVLMYSKASSRILYTALPLLAVLSRRFTLEMLSVSSCVCSGKLIKISGTSFTVSRIFGALSAILSRNKW